MIPSPVKQRLTPSQKLRWIIKLIWQESLERKQGMDEETYYRRRMEQITNERLKELEPPF